MFTGASRLSHAASTSAEGGPANGLPSKFLKTVDLYFIETSRSGPASLPSVLNPHLRLRAVNTYFGVIQG